MYQKDLVWRFPGTSTSTPAPRTRNREPSLTNTRTSTGTPNGCYHYLEPPAPVPASQLREGAARRLGPKVDYNCHVCFTRYTRMPLATCQIAHYSTCPRIRGRQRVLSQNSDCAAGFCSESSTCIWRIKPVGQAPKPASIVPESTPNSPEPMEPAHKKP